MSEENGVEVAVSIPLAKIVHEGKKGLAVMHLGTSEEAVELAVAVEAEKTGKGKRITFGDVIDGAGIEGVADMVASGAVSYVMSGDKWNAPWQPSGEQAMKIMEGRRQARLRRAAADN